MFAPGDLVVCVDLSPILGNVPDALKMGGIYRVEGCNRGIPGHPDSDKLFLRLAGHRNTKSGFRAERFRKLNYEPDNIEIVERIKGCRPTIPKLEPITIKVRELDPEVWGEV